MNSQTIEIEAETLDEARGQIKSQIPDGFHFLSENIISDGSPRVAKAVADTTEVAFEKAQSDIPINALILDKKVLIPSEQKMITVEGFDESTAHSSAKWKARNQMGDGAEVKTLRLLTMGKQGFFGIGKSPNQYEAEISQQAVVEINYKTKVKIAVKVSTVDWLIEAIRDKDNNVQQVAITALKSIGGAKAEQALKEWEREEQKRLEAKRYYVVIEIQHSVPDIKAREFVQQVCPHARCQISQTGANQVRLTINGLSGWELSSVNVRVRGQPSMRIVKSEEQ